MGREEIMIIPAQSKAPLNHPPSRLQDMWAFWK